MTKLNILKKLVVLSVSAFCLHAPAQSSYPNRQITILIPFGVGGSTDLIGRLVAKTMQDEFKQPVVVVNKTGLGGAIALNELTKANPDGYTLAFATGSTTVLPACDANLPFDVTKDLQPVSLIASMPMVMAVNRNSQFRSFNDVRVRSKEKPNSINYSTVHCSIMHFLMEDVKSKENLDFTHIPYGSGPAGISAVLSGDVHVSLEAMTSFGSQFEKDGKLRPIAVTWPTRLSDMPDVPTFAELGFRDANKGTWYGIVAPLGISPEIVNKLNQLFQRESKNPEFQEKIRALGGYTRTGVGPTEFGALIKSDVQFYRKIADSKKIKLN